MKTAAVIACTTILTAGGYLAYEMYATAGPLVSYRTAPVKRGELVLSVTATGTLEPDDLIDVGAQVIGRIKEMGTDSAGKTIDYGSLV